MTFGESCLPPLERDKESHSLLPSIAHILECQDCSSSYRVEDLKCTRPSWMKGYSTWDEHRSCSRELHEMHLDHVHGTHTSYVHGNRMDRAQAVCKRNRMRCTHDQQHEERDSLIFPNMFFNGWILICEHLDHKYEFQISRSILFNALKPLFSLH